MPRRPSITPLLTLLTALGVVLPIGVALLAGLSTLLVRMGDSSGGSVVGWIAVGMGVLWAMDLVLLVLVQALGSLLRSDDRLDEE